MTLSKKFNPLTPPFDLKGADPADNALELTRDSNGDILIKETTSGETVMAFRRTAANTYKLYNNTIKIAESNTNNYTGNSTANRAIPHGLGKTPSIVIISQTGGGTQPTSDFFIFNTGRIDNHFTGGAGNGTVTAPDNTNFYVGINGNFEAGANLNNATYIWVAIG